MKRTYAGLMFLSSLAVVTIGGCGEETPHGPGLGGLPSKIKQLMTKLAKGPTSLTPMIAKELNEDQPPWETIQGQSKEFAQLAAEMVKESPPKGERDSWAKLTSAYTEDANALDKAAQAKDKNAAVAAHGLLATSCKACHDAHRGGPGR